MPTAVPAAPPPGAAVKPTRLDQRIAERVGLRTPVSRPNKAQARKLALEARRFLHQADKARVELDALNQLENSTCSGTSAPSGSGS